MLLEAYLRNNLNNFIGSLSQRRFVGLYNIQYRNNPKYWDR